MSPFHTYTMCFCNRILFTGCWRFSSTFSTWRRHSAPWRASYLLIPISYPFSSLSPDMTALQTHPLPLKILCTSILHFIRDPMSLFAFSKPPRQGQNWSVCIWTTFSGEPHWKRGAPWIQVWSGCWGGIPLALCRPTTLAIYALSCWAPPMMPDGSAQNSSMGHSFGKKVHFSLKQLTILHCKFLPTSLPFCAVSN